MSQATAENLESAARMAMVPAYDDSRSVAPSSSRVPFVYALYAAFVAAFSSAPRRL